jgi:DNA-binding MarR family transcriptional regulator
MADSRQVESLHGSFSRLTRFITQLTREQLSCCPITVQQCYTLEALMGGPKSMKALAAEAAFHQSTMTRIVEKLERQTLVSRTRKAGNERSVEVAITETGKRTFEQLHKDCSQMFSGLVDLIPEDQRADVVAAMETVSRLLDPENVDFQELLRGCCDGEFRDGGQSAGCCGQE